MALGYLGLMQYIVIAYIYLRQYAEDTVIAFILMATHGLGIPWTHALYSHGLYIYDNMSKIQS